MRSVRDEATGCDIVLRRELGAGAEGTAYLAPDARVVKLVPPPAPGDPRPDKVRLLTHLAAGGHLPGGVCWPRGSVVDRVSGHWVGYWMDRAPGRTVFAQAEDRSLGAVPLRRRAAAGARLAAVVAALHDAVHVRLHRIALPDLSARNVVWEPASGAVAVIDSDSCAARFRTPTGMVDDPGSARPPGGTAPEALVAPPARADRYTDLFGLAVVLFELVTGHLPTDMRPGPGVTLPDPDEAVRNGWFPLYATCPFAPPTYAVAPDAIPDELHTLWMRALLDPRAARPTAIEWHAAFERWAAALAPRVGPRWVRRAAVLAATAALGTGLGLWALARGPVTPAAPVPVTAEGAPLPPAPTPVPVARPDKNFGNALLTEVLR